MPDRRHKSKYTADRNIPGAFPGETVTRRRFMTGSVHAAGAVAAGAFTLPALGFALGPVFEGHRAHWEDVGAFGDFPLNTYVPKLITVTQGIGEAGKTTVYMRQRDPAVDTEPKRWFNEVVAISTRCMHAGCPVRYVPASQRFICPCHGGVYDFRGQRTGGPPVRPLDRFYTRLIGPGAPGVSAEAPSGPPNPQWRVEIGPRFSVNSHLRIFSPRDPGEPLDGIGQYLYPSRPTTRKLKGT